MMNEIYTLWCINYSSRTVIPVKENQVLLIDIYNKWTGPCVAAESYLRRMKHEVEPLVLARACCDSIDDLLAFRGYYHNLIHYFT